MLKTFRRLISALIPRNSPLRSLIRAVSERDADRNGWYNIEKYELFPDFGIEPTDVFVDVGCGNGEACRFAAECGAEVIGVDILEDAIAALDKILKKSPARASRTIVSYGNPLPIKDGYANRIVCQEVLEHVEDPAQMMSELVRIGQPGARYLLAVPDPVSESVQKKIAPPAYWAPPNHLRVFQREEFARLVVNSGLRIEKRARYSFYWAMWWVLFWGANKPLRFGSGGSKPLKHWNRLWFSMISDPKYAKVINALEDLMPKSQIIIAVKD